MKKKTAINHAFRFLRQNGYEMIDRDLPCSSTDSRRSSVDLVAWQSSNECMVFFEVVPHATQTKYPRRLVSSPRKKRSIQRKAIRSWLRMNKWCDSFRFDTIEVYGTDDCPNPVIDQISNILFSKRNEQR